MAWRSSPEAPVNASGSGRIGTPLLRLVVCIAAVLAITAVLYRVPLRDRPLSTILCFLVVVLIVSARWGFRYAVFVSLIAALAFSCLVPPVGRFTKRDLRDLYALIAFLVIGGTASHFSDRARREALNAQRAEKAARRSESELRNIVETIPAMVFSIRPDGSTEFVNRRVLEYTGLSAETISGPGWQSTVHPDDLERHMNKWNSAMASGEPFENEVRHRSASGEYRWFLVRAVPLRDEHGEVLKFYGSLTDIEDRNRAEQALRRSEKELRDVIETIPTMAWTTLPDGANDFTNQSWLEYTGITVKDASGAGWKEWFHPADIATQTEKWRESVATGKPFENEARVQRARDGEYRWFLHRAVPLRDRNGTILKWYGISTDIDDRKRAEALLTGEKRILEMVAKGDPLAQILDSLCRLVEEQASGVLTSILLVEGNCLRHGGAPSLPMAYTDAIDGIEFGPSTGSCGTAAYRGQQVIVEDIATDPLWADYRAAALPHSLRACWSTPIFSSHGKVIATFAMYYREPRSPSPRDQEVIEQITHLAGIAIERKQTQDALQRSEASLAEAQRLTHTGSWVWDVRTKEASYLSDEWYRIYGLDPTSDGRAWDQRLQRIHPEDRSKWEAAINRAINGKSDYEFEYRLVLPDGVIKYIHVLGHPVVNSFGDVVQFMGSVTDISERKVAERERERLYQLEADLAHTNRVSMMGELAASLAHEVKQPITAAATNARTGLRWLHREQPNIDEARETISRIVKDVTRAADIIDRNRSLYRRNTPQREMVNLNELIREMIALLHDAANRQSISIRAEVDGTLPPITADRVQMQQVLMNLMLNGIEAMKDTVGELTIRLKKTEDGQIQLSVSDVGIGLPVEDAERIFDAFFSTKAQGTGMGLSISRRIIESHGGRLWATSNPGRGATFHFTVPAEIKAVETALERTGS